MSATSTISEQVTEMHAATPAEPADEVMAAFGEEQAALAAGGVPAGVAEVGVTVSDVDLLDAPGARTITARRSYPTASSHSPEGLASGRMARSISARADPQARATTQSPFSLTTEPGSTLIW